MYGADNLRALFDGEKQSHADNPRQKHKLSVKLRAKMIDWIVECLSIFDLKQDTFFLAVYLFDNYFQKTKKILDDSSIHITGICSMFLASKHEDIRPLFMDQVKHKISHDSYSAKEIRNQELQIVQTLNWKVSLVTPLHFLEFIDVTIRGEYKLLGNDSIMTILNLHATQLAKQSLIYITSLLFKPSEIALTCYYLSIERLLFEPSLSDYSKYGTQLMAISTIVSYSIQD